MNRAAGQMKIMLGVVWTLACAWAVLMLFASAAYAGPSAEKLQYLKQHPFYGYNLIVQIDIAKAGSTLHSQRVRAHRYDPETGSMEFVGRWAASTGAGTPKEDEKGRVARRLTHPGYYFAEFLEIDAWSDAWNGPMPYAVYWDYGQGFAIHATEEYNYFKLGRQASAGCTRLQLGPATQLYATVEMMGKDYTYKLDRHTGKPVRDKNGNPVVQLSYQTLILIEDGSRMEPTRFGFRDRNEVFATNKSYDYYMSPAAVAYGPAAQQPGTVSKQGRANPYNESSVQSPQPGVETARREPYDDSYEGSYYDSSALEDVLMSTDQQGDGDGSGASLN